jgi:Resolvase, N terminal domain
VRRAFHKEIAFQGNSEGKPASGGLLLGYARASKGDEQSNELQAKALRAAGCRRIFEEAASGGRWDRPELHRLLDQLREGDTVVVWKLDRLSRSLLHIMERIDALGDLAQGRGERLLALHPGAARLP